VTFDTQIILAAMAVLAVINLAMLLRGSQYNKIQEKNKTMTAEIAVLKERLARK
jgi:hypothetical protein